ncbi:hypothetical protein [Ruminiclostridium cellulolyticum]|uniref:LemA family protein n=1 Tax=Ruminiclostridium cellulolyticum (strain ATCC 35319 / DSM 5812 / JCM 6584 / H10) TaxID=394503 RepID=B8I6X7_RUMCH|nr:hypothetical protein [Ruminiclostridium cellulolyticum]ACL76969.1 hypothetical protein Ccel_2645 [Ruminiclostridium cellulolyticum H10]
MPTFIAFFVAGICATGFVTIWFTTAYAELSAKRNCLADLDKQLRFHEGLYARARDGPDVESANGMLETSRMLCREASKSYNRILHKPMNLIPALLMGFRAVDEQNKQDKKRG